MPDGITKKRERSRSYGRAWSTTSTRSSKAKPWTEQSRDGLTLTGAQVTESEGHPFQGSYGKSDVGGPFSTEKVAVSGYAGATVSSESADGLTRFIGSVRNPSSPTLGSPGTEGVKQILGEGSLKQTDVIQKGATAVALCAPANPFEKLAVTLAETFKEGLPHLPKVAGWRNRTKEELAKKASGEYLNVSFAALPLIAEIREVIDLFHHFNRTIQQYKRDEGRLVRRSFFFDVEKDTTTTLAATSQAVRIGPRSNTLRLSDGSVPRVDVYQTVHTERKTWFKGAFRYHIPESVYSKMIDLAPFTTDFASRLVGNSLTPEVLWELTPWSWAIDYFSNAQQVIQNLQRFELEGLFMAYGYIMDENIRETTYQCRKSAGSPAGPIPPTYKVTQVSKVREKANPYGFGISWDELTPFQVANLFAAGIHRLL